jgi:GT2 family glycosyltransferase
VTYAAAMNAALRETGGELVLLLNADCTLEPGALKEMAATLSPGVGSVAPRLLRASDGAIDAAGMVVDRRRKNGLVGHGAPGSSFGAAGECFGADGACALYRRAVLDACALDGEVLDEDMALWASDADLAWRARLLGWRCAYAPGAVARHRRTYSPSTRAAIDPAHRRLQFRNRYLMWLKNETARGLLVDLPFWLPYELAQLVYVVLRERDLLAGYADAWRLRGGAARRRRAVQARRVVARPPFGLRVRAR